MMTRLLGAAKLALCVAALGAALGVTFGSSSANAAIVNISTQGVIVEGLGGYCITFEADNGSTYLLNTLQTFTPGDRVHVSGSYDDTTSGFCFNTGGPRVTVSSIQPAFAGVGTLVSAIGGLRLQTDDGRTFLLQNSGPYRAGARVYVQGIVTFPSRSAARIDNTVIGPAFSDFGRVTDLTPGHLRFKSDAGVVYSLDRTGNLPTYSTLVGTYVFVEGIRGKIDGGVIPLTSVTARPAFNASGRVVATANGVAFDGDTLILQPLFTAAALANVPVGSKVYLRGRGPDDYDYGEAKPANNIRLSRVGPSYTALGYLDIATKTVINLEDGAVINVEYTGDPLFNPSGSLVYVAGELASQGPNTVTLSNNQTRIGVIVEGYLGTWVDCSPVVLIDGGGRILPRNTAPFVLGNRVRVAGGYTFDVPCDEEGGLVDNTIVEANNESRPGK